MKKSLLLFLLIAIISNSQIIASEYKISPQAIRQHIEVLAHDSLEGRQVGEPGELKAAEYIRSVFKSAGLLSVGIDDYFEYYDFLKEIKITEKNSLLFLGLPLKLYEDFIPLKQSASTSFSFKEIVDVGYGIKTGDDSGSYNDYANLDVAGKAVLIKRFSPLSEDYPNVNFSNYESINDKINTAIKHNVAAIFFETPEGHVDTLIDRGVTNIHQRDIPIIFLKQLSRQRRYEEFSHVTSKIKFEETGYNEEHYTGTVEIVKVRDTAQNVIGFIKGQTDTTIIIGAHYDHLGWGAHGSLYIGEKAIHNGADDNASGVAALLELARKYAQSEKKFRYSLMFIAFSGEEAGLLGSNNFVKNMTIDSSKIRMMINMDMIGRLKDQDNGLAILGVGTTDEFTKFFDSLHFQKIKLTLKKSGIGPSDHTVFYNRKIPVLHLFTGAHSDYHKPSDDIEKIDFEGISHVCMLVDTIITHFDNFKQPLTFKKTKDSSEGKRRKKYSVTLGVMPDYTAEVTGLKIDGVIEERPAALAGMLKGDVVVQLGNIKIADIYDYMDALSKFKKGDTVVAIVTRNDKRIELSVTF